MCDSFQVTFRGFSVATQQQVDERNPANAEFIKKLQDIPGLQAAVIGELLRIASQFKQKRLSEADMKSSVEALVGHHLLPKVQFAMMYIIEAPDSGFSQTGPSVPSGTTLVSVVMSIIS